MADDDTDDTAAANHSIPDPFALAIGLCQVAANAKTIEPALKRLRKLGHDIAKAEQKLTAVTAQVEQKQARLNTETLAPAEQKTTLRTYAGASSQTLEGTMKRRQYHQRTVKRHYGGELRGLAHNQLFQQRGHVRFWHKADASRLSPNFRFLGVKRNIGRPASQHYCTEQR
jgi:hypothetical protein